MYTLTTIVVLFVCLFQNNQICHVEIWDRPWLELRELTSVSCNSSENAATASESRSKRVCIAFTVALCLQAQNVAL